MNRIKKILIFIIMIAIFLQLSPPINSSAKVNNQSNRGYDIYTKEYTNVFSHTKRMISITPSAAETNTPADVKTVSFKAFLTGYLHYDALTNKYVSASSPTIWLEYQGPVALSLESASTYQRDNGKTVTFYYSGKLKGRVTSSNGIICTVDYGNISGNFTISK